MKLGIPSDNSYRIRLKMLAIESVVTTISLARNTINRMGDDVVNPKHSALADQLAAEQRVALEQLETSIDGVSESFIEPIFDTLPDEIQSLVRLAFPDPQIDLRTIDNQGHEVVIQPDWGSLCNEASALFVRLREAQTQCPKKSIQRQETGRLAHAIDCWCRFVEDNSENWSG